VAPASAQSDEAGSHVVLCGFGRVGSAVGEALDTFGLPYAVIERDPHLVKALRARGVSAHFGNAARQDLLLRAGVDRAALAVIALPDIDPARLAVRTVRAVTATLPILARAHGRAEAEALKEVGATEVIQPEMEASVALIRRALATLKLPNELAFAYLERFRAAIEKAQGAAARTPDALPDVQDVRIGGGSLADQSLREARIRERFGVTIVAVNRADRVILNPPPETILRPGDTVRVFGLPSQIAGFMREAENQSRP
jgi:CPA2 family monovalent cation:H+ antiporter-2